MLWLKRQKIVGRLREREREINITRSEDTKCSDIMAAHLAFFLIVMTMTSDRMSSLAAPFEPWLERDMWLQKEFNPKEVAAWGPEAQALAQIPAWLGFGPGIRAREEEQVRLNVERAIGKARADTQVPEPPARERKAGCKNFFWKTFTSC